MAARRSKVELHLNKRGAGSSFTGAQRESGRGEKTPRRQKENKTGRPMTMATLQLNIIPKRMLTKKEAAHHCGRPVKRFEIECAVETVRFPNGDIRYDVKDLDAWLDQIKDGASSDTDDIVARLG